MNNFLLLCIYITIIFFVVTINISKYKVVILPNFIFTAMWSFCGIFSIYNSLGLIKPSLKIHRYIFTTIIIFNLIYIMFTKKIIESPINQNKYKYKINYKIVYLLIALAFILIMPNFIKAVKLVLYNGLNLNLIRTEVYVAISNSNNFFYAFLTKNVPIAIFNVISLISSMEFFRINNKRLVKVNVVCIIIGTITFGGRYLLLDSIIFYTASFLIFKRYKKIKLNKSYIFIGILALFSITLSRGTNGMSFFDMIINYFVGSLSYLQVIINSPYLFGLNDPIMYGYLTFGFLLEPIVLIIKFLFKANIDVPSYYFNIYSQPFVNIGEESIKLYNNNNTILYIFLRDFGECGIILGTAILSLMICMAQARYYKNGNLRALIFLIYMHSVIVNSVMMYTMGSISSSLILIFALLCINRRRLIYNK